MNKIVGWRIQVYTNEYPNLGHIKSAPAVEFGNSPKRDKAARVAYIQELVTAGADFAVTPIWRGK